MKFNSYVVVCLSNELIVVIFRIFALGVWRHFSRILSRGESSFFVKTFIDVERKQNKIENNPKCPAKF